MGEGHCRVHFSVSWSAVLMEEAHTMEALVFQRGGDVINLDLGRDF